MKNSYIKETTIFNEDLIKVGDIFLTETELENHETSLELCIVREVSIYEIKVKVLLQDKNSINIYNVNNILDINRILDINEFLKYNWYKVTEEDLINIYSIFLNKMKEVNTNER